MTSEQNERWRAAILGAGPESPYKSWEALYAVAARLPEPAVFLRKTLHKSAKRLVGWGVPGWAASLWKNGAVWGWREGYPETVSFAVRSKTALVGLRILAPTRYEGAPIYHRLLLRFLHEVYRPFVDWVQQGDSTRQREFQGVVALYELCGHPRAADRIEWVNLLIALGEQIGDATLSKAHADLLVCFRCTEVVQLIVFGDEEKWWRATGADLAERIIGQYYRAPDSNRTPDRPVINGAEAIATAFLIALESECPTPDWLLRVEPLKSLSV